MATKKAHLNGQQIKVIFGIHPELTIYTVSHKIDNIKVTGISKEIEQGCLIDLFKHRWTEGRDFDKRFLQVHSVSNFDSKNSSLTEEERKNLLFEANCSFVNFKDLTF